MDSSTSPQLQQLNDKCLLNIFKHLDLNDVLNVAYISTRFRHLVIEHYLIPVFRIHTKTIHLSARRNEFKMEHTVIIKRSISVLRFLRCFGHLITDLKFSEFTFYIRKIAIEINNYIRKYCSGTLAKLELIHASTRLAIGKKNIFPRVTILKAQFFRESAEVTIDRIYPALKELSFSFFKPMPSSVAVLYPHLKRFNLHNSGNEEWKDGEVGLRHFLRVNPQLLELNLYRELSFDLLKFISLTLTKLEYLSITYNKNLFQVNEGIVHFDRVKSFKICVYEKISYAYEVPMTFNQLEALGISSPDYLPVGLFNQNPGLRCISLPETKEKDAVKLLNEVEPLSVLEEIEIQWDDIEDTSAITSVIDKYETVKKMTLIVRELRGFDLEVDIIKASFQNKWRVIDICLKEICTIYEIYHVILTRI